MILNAVRSKVSDETIDGILRITPARHMDSRGYFSEVFKDEWFRQNVFDSTFVQDNESLSVRVGTLRGLHFQAPPFAQGKLVRCLHGALLDVAVDIRTGSPTFGHWVAEELAATSGRQLWVPPGFAHGFVTLEPNTVISYKVTAPYSPKHDLGISWNDPTIGIVWPMAEKDMVVSRRDREHPRLLDIPPHFHYLVR